MNHARNLFLTTGQPVFYGTVRLIETETETLLRWARKPWVSIIFNLTLEHCESGIEKTSQVGRKLIDLALNQEGSYNLSYHKWATREQMLKAYPDFPKFIQTKEKIDPNNFYTSDWYQHLKQVFTGGEQ